jgi:CHAD domain-containing protein
MTVGKWIEGLTAATPVVEAARCVLEMRLEAVQHGLASALQQEHADREAVHQLRVSTRRAAAALAIFKGCLPSKLRRRLRRRLRKLRRAAGNARDWDVFLMDLEAGRPGDAKQVPGMAFLQGYAGGQRHGAQPQLEKAGAQGRSHLEKWRAELDEALRPDNSGPEQKLVDLARPLLEGWQSKLEKAAAQDLKDYANLHQVRIAGKKLRYGMEIFVDCFEPPLREKLYPQIEALQDILGRANDSHVASQRLLALRDQLKKDDATGWKRYQPAFTRWIRFHQRRLPQERRRFQQWWKQWQDSAAIFRAFLEPNNEET